MRILLVGGTGPIGSAIHARLSAEGHDCVLVSRHPTALSDTRHITLDMARTTDASRWKAFLQASMPLSMPRARCRGTTCKAFMSPAALRAMRPAVAAHHVDEGRRIVEQQRRRIAESGAGSDEVDLLKTFEHSLAIFEADLARLLKERDRK